MQAVLAAAADKNSSTRHLDTQHCSPSRLSSAFSVSKDEVQLVRPAGQLIGRQLPFMKGE